MANSDALEQLDGITLTGPLFPSDQYYFVCVSYIDSGLTMSLCRTQDDVDRLVFEATFTQGYISHSVYPPSDV
jgi:hypothetical protein